MQQVRKHMCKKYLYTITAFDLLKTFIYKYNCFLLMFYILITTNETQSEIMSKLYYVSTYMYIKVGFKLPNNANNSLMFHRTFVFAIIPSLLKKNTFSSLQYFFIHFYMFYFYVLTLIYIF